MKILDIFPYYNEKELLELRINLLKDHVDSFIICDADRTHTGVKKEFSCKKTLEELGLTSDKITVLEVNLPSKEEIDNNWVRENMQRDAGARMIGRGDVAFIGDCDEMINPSYLKYYASIANDNPECILRVPLAYLNCRADLCVVDENGNDRSWNPAYMCMSHHVGRYRLSQIRESYTLGLNNIVYPNISTFDNGVIELAGWHFSWMGSSERLKTKYQSIADFQDFIPNAAGGGAKPEEVLKFIDLYNPEAGKTDPLGRNNHILKKYPIEKLPSLVTTLPKVKKYLLPARQKTIIFHDNCLGFRGTTVALFDYAKGCRDILKMNVIIAYPASFENEESVISKFAEEFQTFSYVGKNELIKLADGYKADYFYAIKYGTKDDLIIPGCINLVHSVFCTDSNEIHGDVYATVSAWQNKKNPKIPFVPHIVDLPKHDRDLRASIGIRTDEIVIGRYGGYDTFDIDFVKESIKQALESRKDLWFIFMNTEKFCDHERCIFFEARTDAEFKVEFINTCDAMIHSRSYGETFGLSVLEFASKDKQIISYSGFSEAKSNPLGGMNHWLFLDSGCYWYAAKDQLNDIFRSISKPGYININLGRSLRQHYGPDEVMKKFKSVFLSNVD